MPDSYNNPSYKPPTRPYTWIPNTIPTGGDTPLGFYSTHIVRGAFRNDVPVQEGFSGGSVSVNILGTLVSSELSKNNPILSVHRPMADPDNDRGDIPDEKFHIKGADFKWEAELSSTSRLSSITLEYALIVDVNDPNLLSLLDSEDQALLKNYLSNPTGEPPGIDWNKYKFAKITLDDIEYPVIGTDNQPQELSVTGINTTTTSKTVKFVQSFISNDFPIVKKLAIQNRVGLNTLQLIIAKIYIFNAERVNLHDEQLPCSLMEYAYPVRFAFNPNQSMDSQRLPFPSDADNPNFHIKIYSPEEIIAKQYGLAHSINLRFLLFSMPIFDPLGIFNLYFAIFSGPAPGRRTVKMALSGQFLQSSISNVNKRRVVVADSVNIEKATKSLRIEKIESNTSIPTPSPNDNWIRIDDSEYDINGTNIFDSEGPYISEYLFLDNSTSEFNWYRVVQLLSSGGEKISEPFKNQTYAEKNIYKALPSATTTTRKDVLTRRIPLITDFNNNDPLNASTPLATFVMDGFDGLSNPINIRKGAFKLALQAQVDDENSLLTSHIFARFWFVPSNVDINMNELYQWRDATEIHFETNISGTKIVKGKPRTMQDLIISPPIPNSTTFLDMTRYNDEILALNTPFSSGSRLIVALYAVGYPTDDGNILDVNKNTINLPSITLSIDSQYGLFDTPIQYAQSDVIFAQRADRYNSSQFISLDKPLVVTTSKIGGDVLSDDGIYPTYNTIFNSNNTEPLNGLLKLDTDSNTIAQFCIPTTAIPSERDEKTYVMADFATGGKVLDAGRILNGDWEVDFTINRNLDTNIIAIDYRIEMFLVSSDGKVTERIFRSSIIPSVTVSGDANIVYKTNIQVPMIIGGSGTQLVMRLIGYPYSRNGTSVDVSTLQNQLGDVPLGLRIDKLQITNHTISRLLISQAASFLGSPSFYEQLQLIPNQSIGQTSDFWFIASEFLTNTFVIDGNVGINITGSLYSPAWFINMPKNMEVVARGQGFLDHDVWFRTVASDEAGGGEVAITAVEDKISKTIHLAHESQEVVSEQTVVSFANENTIRHKTFETPYRVPLQNYNVAGNTPSGISVLNNKVPNLYFVNSGTFSNNSSGILGLVSQYEGNDYASAQVNLNTSVNGFGTWFASNRDLSDKDFSVVKTMAEGLSSVAFSQSSTSGLSYIAGWSEPGSIVVKEVNLWDSNVNNANGTLYLIDGLLNANLPDNSPLVIPSFLSNLKANKTFPGILIDSYDNILIAYTLEGRTGELYARILSGGQNLSNPYVIATFRNKQNLISDVDIFAPTMCWHDATQSYYVAFWCNGKIFFTTFNGFKTSSGILMNPLQLVAGNNDFSNGNNASHALFEALVLEGAMINNQLGNHENDVLQQRVGMFISDKWPFQGNAFIYYYDSNNKLMVRQVRIAGITGAQQEIA